MWRSTYVAAWVLAVATAGCAGPARTGTKADSKIGSEPVSSVELVISGLSRSDAEAFRGQILSQGDVSNVVLKSYVDDVATYELDVHGCECDLPAKMARIQSPGFRYEGRKTRIEYTAFDNKPPVVVFVHPETDDRELSEPDQRVLVNVKDSDIKEVRVNDVIATRVGGDTFLAHVLLPEGRREIRVVATDRAGNETVERRWVTLRKISDSNPSLQMLVEGRVTPGSTVVIEGKEIPVDARGHYSVTIPIKPGQTQIEVIAISPDGKKAVTVKELGGQ